MIVCDGGSGGVVIDVRRCAKEVISHVYSRCTTVYYYYSVLQCTKVYYSLLHCTTTTVTAYRQCIVHTVYHSSRTGSPRL